MREIKIAYHYVDTARMDSPLPVDDIVAVFRTATIALQLVESFNLEVDPNSSALNSYKAIVEKLPKEPLGNGHLFVGLAPPDRAPSIAGELLDIDKRRASVVYTLSSYLYMSPMIGLLQTSIHEIGHMLNLGHPLKSETKPSAMSQIPDRKGDIGKSWIAESVEAAKMQAVGKPSFYLAPQRTIASFPFLASDRNRLNTLSDLQVLPGGNPYEFAAEMLGD